MACQSFAAPKYSAPLPRQLKQAAKGEMTEVHALPFIGKVQQHVSMVSVRTEN
ncbi:hypothetical protein ABID21_002211 [Pseudorhizobium tarimense]|uniref:Uncharacterized protein n=1 Tax=Pseudorhizobium tarimense TaxID=1079109 RepID=A0ABV2H6H0_9HYPH